MFQTRLAKIFFRWVILLMALHAGYLLCVYGFTCPMINRIPWVPIEGSTRIPTYLFLPFFVPVWLDVLIWPLFAYISFLFLGGEKPILKGSVEPVATGIIFGLMLGLMISLYSFVLGTLAAMFFGSMFSAILSIIVLFGHEKDTWGNGVIFAFVVVIAGGVASGLLLNITNGIIAAWVLGLIFGLAVIPAWLFKKIFFSDFWRKFWNYMTAKN